MSHPKEPETHSTNTQDAVPRAPASAPVDPAGTVAFTPDALPKRLAPNPHETVAFTPSATENEPPSPTHTVAYSPPEPDGANDDFVVNDLVAADPGPNADAMPGTLILNQSSEPSQDSRERKAPTLVGYQILGELGRGGMGVVYRARHIKLDREVALKMIIAGAHAGHEQLARFYAEAKACAHLQHPNIVQIYEVGEQDGLPYFSLEFVDGGSLTQKTGGKPQAVKEAGWLVEKLARAMHYAHQHGIVHRDLKPANVLLTRQGEPKITDFGLAKRLEGESSSQTRSGAILGTPSYMAPEQAMGEVHQIGPLTDVYSIGGILYELLTGRPPFAGPTPMDTIQQVVRDEPVPPTQLQPKVPSDLETICLKCLQKEQAKRYSSAETLADDLRRFLAGEPILARPVSAPERLWRWCRRNPKIAASIAAVAVSMVTATVVSISAAITVAHERDAKEEQRQAAVAAEAVAEQQRAEAEAAELRAKRSEQVAGEQRDLATETLYNLITKVDEQLRDRTEMQKLRLELIDDAMDGLLRVDESDATKSVVARTIGVGHQRRAEIYQQMSRSEESREEHQRGLAIFERLLEQDPQNHPARWNAALSCDSLGNLCRVLDGNTVATRDYYLKALEHREKLPDDFKMNKQDVKTALLNSYAKLGTLSMSAGDMAGAREYFRKMLTQSQALFDANPDNPQAKQALAGVYSILGRVSLRLRDVEAAKDYYNKALEHRRQLAAKDKLSVAYRQGLADTLGAIGDLHLQSLGEPAAALVYYEESQTIHAELHTTNPQDAASQAGLGLTYYRIGTAHVLMGNPDQGKIAYSESLKLREDLVSRDKTNTSKLTGLIHVRARLGQHAEAFQLAEDLRARVTEDPETLYNLVCGYSLCATAIRQDRKLDDMPAEERTLYSQYVATAIDTLRKATELGYNNASALETDPDLIAIRETTHFATILRDLKK